MINKLDKFHKTKSGLLIFALLELGIAYWFASLSIDRGNFAYYILTFIFLFGFLQNSFKLIRNLTNGKRKPSKTR